MDRRNKAEQSASNLSWWGCGVSCRPTLDEWAPPGSLLGVAQWSKAPECCLQAHVNCDWILELAVARSSSPRSPYFLARFQMNRKAEQFRRLNEDQLSVSVQSPVRSPVTGSQRGEKMRRNFWVQKRALGKKRRPGWDSGTDLFSRQQSVLMSTNSWRRASVSQRYQKAAPASSQLLPRTLKRDRSWTYRCVGGRPFITGLLSSSWKPISDLFPPCRCLCFQKIFFITMTHIC